MELHSLNKIGFIQWLGNQPANRSLGDGSTARCKSCPIATWLLEAVVDKGAEIRVGKQSIIADFGSTRFRMSSPEWVADFVKLFDDDDGSTAFDAYMVCDALWPDLVAEDFDA